MAIKVMIIIPGRSISGPVKGIFQLIENLSSKGIDFGLYGFLDRSTEVHHLFNAAQERGIDIDLLDQRNGSHFSLIKQVIREIDNKGYHIVQTHGFKPTFLGFFARILCRVKWICFMHGYTSENLKIKLYHAIDSLLQRAADKTVIVSSSQRELLWGGKNKSRVHVIHNAVDACMPMPVSGNQVSIKQLLGISQESWVFVTVGRLSPEKGIDILLDAFALLVKRSSSMHLLVLGDGQERFSLETQANCLGITGNVHFVGYTSVAGDYVLSSDILVLPSRSEGIPNVVLEAMALGRPVVATHVGGVPEIIEDGFNGLLVPAEDPQALATGIEKLMAEPVLYKKITKEGKNFIQEKFSIETRMMQIKALYQNLLLLD